VSASHSVQRPPRHPARLLVPATVLAGFALLLAFAFRDALRPSVPVQAVPVAVRSIEVSAGSSSATVGEAILAPGWIEADPYMHQVVALVDGVVEEILVLEGTAVNAGEPVARLVAEDARIAVDQAEADLADATAAVARAAAVLSAAEADLEHLVAPQRRVAAARADVDRLAASAAATEASARALDATARELADELARLEALVPRGGASEAAVERLRLRVESASAAADARRREAEAATQAIAVAEAERRAAERDLELLIAETLAVAEAKALFEAAEAGRTRAVADLADARLHLDRTVVRSPIDGVVAELEAVPGSTLVAGSAGGAVVLRVFDPRRLGVRVDVPISEVARVAVGQRAEIVVDTLPGVVFEAEVSRLVRRADLAKNTLPVKVRLLDPDPRLVPDMLARVRILTEGRADADGAATTTATRVFAPEAAWSSESRSGSVTSVAVVGVREGRGTASHRTLVLGETRIDGWREVVEGLRPGEWVVLGAAPADGAAVHIVDATSEEARP
jgi:RND family efflux transporter MFP subunit